MNTMTKSQQEKKHCIDKAYCQCNWQRIDFQSLLRILLSEGKFHARTKNIIWNAARAIKNCIYGHVSTLFYAVFGSSITIFTLSLPAFALLNLYTSKWGKKIKNNTINYILKMYQKSKITRRKFNLLQIIVKKA